MPKVMCLTLYNRPQYDRLLFKSLSKCVGIGEYVLVISIDPGNDEVVSLARGISFAETRITVNRWKLGCQQNIFQAWNDGFSLSDFVIYMDDDNLAAPDMLRFFEFAAAKYRSDPTVFSVGAYRYLKAKDRPISEEPYYHLEKASGINSFVLGTWRDRWEEKGGMRQTWDLWQKGGGWDIVVDNRVRGSRFEVKPSVGRALNIGEDGAHTLSAKWHRENVLCGFWAGHPDVEEWIGRQAGRWPELATF